MTELMSPVTGAAIGRLLSSSAGSMSTWTKRQSADHCGGWPCPRSQFSRAPSSITTSACADRQRAGRHRRLRVVIGQQALGHRHRQERDTGGLDERRGSRLLGPRVGGALADHDQRPLRPGEQIQRPVDRLGRGQLARGRVDHLEQRLPGPPAASIVAPSTRRAGPGRPRPGRPETAVRMARATPIPISSRPLDPVGGLGQLLGRGHLIELLIVALLQVDDRPVARTG